MTMEFRPEEPTDHSAIHELLNEAFGGEGESKLVDDCHASDDFIPELSIVALDEGKVVGHILFHPIEIATIEGNVDALSLAPMAVSPHVQNKGIGKRLVMHGLSECRRLGHEIVVVIGHPNFYPKFGFVQAGRKGLEIQFPVPPEAFMVHELIPGALDGVEGIVKFPDIFEPLF